MDKNILPVNIKDEFWMIPCFINREANTFQPLYTPAEHETPKLNLKLPWTEEEDETLKALTRVEGKKPWSKICREINKLHHRSKPVRKNKQCRERFFNHINPVLRKGNWTPEEDIYILQMQSTIGNKWSDIAKSLEGRNENQIKNRWKTLVSSNNPYFKSEVMTPLSLTPDTSMSRYTQPIGFSSLAETMSQCYSASNDPTPPYNYFYYTEI